MSGFEKQLRGLDRLQLGDLAGQLLEQLSPGETAAGTVTAGESSGEDFKFRRGMEFRAPETESRADSEPVYPRDTVKTEKPEFSQPESERSGREFYEPGESARAQERSFADPAEYAPGQAFYEPEFPRRQEMPGFSRLYAAQSMQQRDMAEISDFFRRCGRGYDSGFKRY